MGNMRQEVAVEEFEGDGEGDRAQHIRQLFEMKLAFLTDEIRIEANVSTRIRFEIGNELLPKLLLDVIESPIEVSIDVMAATIQKSIKDQPQEILEFLPESFHT